VLLSEIFGLCDFPLQLLLVQALFSTNFFDFSLRLDPASIDRDLLFYFILGFF
jgi:hypothetical protein